MAIAVPLQATTIDRRKLAAFEDRYGIGAHAKLLKRLEHPCVTFAQIAIEFGVTRERVRQWQVEWLPAAPRGRERRRRCLVLRQRRALLEEPLFRTFYKHVRPHVAPGTLALVPTRAGFRRRVVRIGDRLVFIKAARPYRHHGGDASAYSLTTYRGAADFIYFQLNNANYLFMPAGVLPMSGTTFLDTPTSKYRRFRNTLAALGAHVDGEQAVTSGRAVEGSASVVGSADELHEENGDKA